MENEIAVSVICNVYNHGPYIAQCLEGFVKQKTSFPFEVLVHDDASTDDSARIIREYENKYSHLIKPIYQTENQYSKGGISQFQYPRAKGKYIAFCEGDDFWTDDQKLQKQFDALEANPDVDICAHASAMLDGRTDREIRQIAPRKCNAVIPVEEVILGGGGFVATNSLFYRAELLKDPPLFRKMSGLDYTMQIYGSLRGGMLYLKDCMSSYRFMTAGSWTVTQWNDEKKRRGIIDRINRMLDQLDVDTQGRYHDVIRLKQEFDILKDDCEYRKLISEEYRRCFATLSSMERRHIFLKAWFPLLFRVWKKIRKK